MLREIRREELLWDISCAMLVVFLAVFLTSCSGGLDNDTVVASGTIEATDVNIASRVAGEILDLNVNEGTRVLPDDTIAVIDHSILDLQLRRAAAGMALAEAMACECVPVVTNNAALPEVVGDTGFYVPYGDPKATADAIEKALKSNKGNVARERIKKMFPLNRRENDLIQVIYEVMG